MRAISVILILLFHLDLKGFEAGYVGVDVFMVISGFLITGVLLKSDDRSLFWPFWDRRVRRLLPALIASLALSTLLAFLSLSPGELTTFGKASLYTLSYVVNFHLVHAGDYFSPSAAFNYHLHYWSLAVEEQFYLAAPFMVFLFRRSKWFIPLLVATWVVSFVLGATSALLMKGETYSFYMAPTRAWQFLTGGLVWILAARAPRSILGATSLAAVGLALISASMVIFDKNTLFPGFAALVPVAGAAMILFAGCVTTGPLQRAMGVAPLSLIGNMSYSLYLLHWPIFVFARHFNGEKELTVGDAPLLLLVTFIIAYLSWKFVEMPFRNNGISASKFYASLSVPLVILITISTAVIVSGGYPQRIAAVHQEMRLPEDQAVVEHMLHCIQKPYTGAADELCRVGGKETSEKTILVWGDSHAFVLSTGIADVAADQIDQTIGASSSCPPLLVSHPLTQSFDNCDGKNTAVRRLLQENNDVEAVVLMAYWSVYFQNPGTDHDALATNLIDTAEFVAAQDIPLVIVAGTPAFDRNPAMRARVRANFGLEDRTSIPRETYSQAEEIPREVLRQMADVSGALLLFPDDLFCNETDCSAWLDNVILYGDDNHLSPIGAHRLATMLLERTNIFDGVLSATER